MPTLRLTQTIDRPPHDVYAVLTDVAHIADWNPTVSASRQTSDGAPGEGTRFEMTVSGFGAVPQTLEEVEPDRTARYVPHFKVMSGGHRFTLSADGNGTRVDHELEMRPRGVFVLMSPMMGMMGRKNLRATADALKQFVESKPRG